MSSLHITGVTCTYDVEFKQMSCIGIVHRPTSFWYLQGRKLLASWFEIIRPSDVTVAWFLINEFICTCFVRVRFHYHSVGG